MHTQIAIGGTKGKTTTMSIIEHCLLNMEPQCNVITASSTEGIFLNKDKVKEAIVGNYFAATDIEGKRNLNHSYFLSEATSFLLQNGYYENKKTHIAIFTGIEETEHMEIHRTFENYLNAKKKLYDGLNENDIAIINLDNKYSNYIYKDCPGKIVRIGENEKSDCRIYIVEQQETYSKIILEYKNEKVEIISKLVGIYNARNIACAYMALIYLGYAKDDIIKYISTFSNVAGRYEVLKLSDGNTVIIDYAHSPESLREVLSLIRNIYTNKEIITIFGCGGGKSKTKRPWMGRIASKLSDFVYVTSDNPRNENKKEIIAEIISGFDKKNYMAIVSRKMAVEKALRSHKDSIILLAGKGNETYTLYNKRMTDGSESKKVDSYIYHYCRKKISDRELVTEAASKNGTMVISSSFTKSDSVKQKQIQNKLNKWPLMNSRPMLSENCFLAEYPYKDILVIKTLPGNTSWYHLDKLNGKIIMSLNGKRTISQIIRKYGIKDNNDKTILKRNLALLYEKGLIYDKKAA